MENDILELVNIDEIIEKIKTDDVKYNFEQIAILYFHFLDGLLNPNVGFNLDGINHYIKKFGLISDNETFLLRNFNKNNYINSNDFNNLYFNNLINDEQVEINFNISKLEQFYNEKKLLKF